MPAPHEKNRSANLSTGPTESQRMETETPAAKPASRRRRYAGILQRICFSLVIGLLLVASGYAYWYTHRPQPFDMRAELFPGVRYQRASLRKPRPIVVHTVTVQLNQPGVSLLVTPGDPGQSRPLRARTTSQFVQEFGVKVAINGDFFFPFWSRTPFHYYPHVGDPVELEGHAISRGVLYSFGGERWKFPVLYFAHNNRGIFNRIPKNAYNALSGSTMLLEKGAISTRVITERDYLDPRTAVALDKDSRTLILIVVDGRQPNYSEGVTLRELAALLKEHGAHDAMNLDGGGSSTLVVADKKGRPMILNSPINNRIPGRERPVANHLGVFVSEARP